MTQGPGEPILKVEHLKQYFKTGRAELKAVDGISFEVRRGEVFGIVGESGCGKTTAARSIIGLYDITGGDIWFKGRRIATGIPDMKKRIKRAQKAGSRAEAALLSETLRKNIEEARTSKRSGIMTGMQMVFQDPVASLNPRMTVREIIAEGLIISGMRGKEEISLAVASALEQVGLLAEHAGRYPHEFSGGQRQRIGIARAIALKPELIIADEPISALDVSVQAQVINLLNELRRQMGLTLIFISHDLSVVKYFSDRIAVMYGGKIVELAEARELFSRPAHPYTRALLSSIPLPDPYYEKRKQRLTYNPVSGRGCGGEPPQLREIFPGHYVSCGRAEYERLAAAGAEK